MDAEITGQTKAPVFSYHGDTGELFKIYIVNFLLTIVTLGIYRFWGKTKIRKYLWSHIDVQGDRLEYTGTPKELLVGFMVVLFFILIPLFAVPEFLLFLADDGDVTTQTLVGSAQALFVYLLIPAAIYRARRYRLSRTLWRAIRAGQSGSAWIYALKSIFYFIVELFTLGMTVPIFRKKLADYRFNNTWFGNTRLTFTAKAGPLYGPFFGMIGLYATLFIVLLVVQFAVGGAILAGMGLPQPGLIFDPQNLEKLGTALLFPFLISLFIFLFLLQGPRLWYIAAELNYFTSKTKLDNLQFQLNLSRGHYMWFVMFNQFVTLFSLGLALPYVYNRYLRYFADRLTYSGDFNALLVAQSEQAGPERGEGLADAFDVGGL